MTNKFLENLEYYFSAEKTNALLIIVVALATLLFSLGILNFVRSPFYMGLVIPLIGIGLFELFVGANIFLRSNLKLDELKRNFHDNVHLLKSKELIRMEVILERYRMLRHFIIASFLLGLAMFMVFSNSSFQSGFGGGLFAQAILGMGLIHSSEKRSSNYFQHVKWLGI